MAKIYLTGYMYSGKTTLGKQLARRLSYDFFDTDQLFEEKFKISIPTFFERYGEVHFRTMEQQILHTTENLKNAVISTGGGTACFNRNMEWMHEQGITIYLKMSPERLFSRYKVSKKKRPLLDNLSPEQTLNYIRNHLTEREQFYSKAQIIFETEHLNIDTLEKVIRFII